eukprot:362408-Chlamydomonas_euryale.AAC.2
MTKPARPSSRPPNPPPPADACKTARPSCVCERRRGKFRAIGVSNYEVEHLSELLSVAAVPPAVNQFECHPRRPAHALRAACAAAGVAAVAYASLGCGQLLREPTVAAAADAAGVPPAALLLRWGLEQGCAVIPKSVDPRRVRAFAEPALLSSDVWGRREAADALSRLEALDDGHKFCWDPQGIRQGDGKVGGRVHRGVNVALLLVGRGFSVAPGQGGGAARGGAFALCAN